MTVNKVAEVSAQYLAELDENAVPSGYKQTEVGVIPEDWDVENLQKLTVLIIDGTHHTPRYTTYGVPFLRVTDIQGELDDSEFKYVSEEEHAYLIRRCRPQKGDLLLSKNGTIGIPKVVSWEWEFSIFVSLALIKLKKNLLEVNYLEQFFKSDFLDLQLAQRAKQGTVTNLHLEEIREILIPLPRNKEEQTAIANALSDVDALISELEKLIAKKQSIKTATMQQLLTGRTRLPQFALREDGSKKGYKQSELGEIPEDWDVVTLGEICNFENGDRSSNYPSAHEFVEYGVSFINAGHVADGLIDLRYMDYIPEHVYERLGGGKVAAGDVLFCLRGSLGKFGVVPEEFGSGAIASSLVIIRPKKHRTTTDYVSVYFKSEFSKEMITLWAGGAAQPNLGARELANFLVPLSSKEEQGCIATILSDMDTEIQALQQRLTKTRQIKQGMMQELLTGKTRLIQPAGSTN
ncbi:restriction endonuclease subunit S [Ketobacter alkanivorans]|uniref:restriction endonuclease subunit S n=1 Tax=Ketobacter alkanivorans TaxID=1917421 RepID=UPI0013155410|nr:restriction endonuclease subunit S [Ketobacter alkanivorans]